MTFETTAGGKAGLKMERDDGTVTTLRTAIAKHFTASMATIATAVEQREERLRDFREHFVSAMQVTGKGQLRRVYLGDSDPERRNAMVKVLLRQGIEVQVLGEKTEVPDALNYLGGEAASTGFPAGTWMIDLAQPKGRLARALLEPHTPIDEEFLGRQIDKNTRNAARGTNVTEDGWEFYDVTAWTLPLMYGVEAFMSDESPVVSAVQLMAVPADTGDAPTHLAKSAYVIPVGSDSSQQIVIDLLSEGYRVATAVRPFDAGGQAFDRGSFIVRVERNPATLHARIRELVAERGAKVVAIDTAWTMQGITGIGSESVYALTPPKILLVAGDGVDPNSYGALSFLFEKTFEIDHVPVATSRVKSVDLSQFNVVIIPSGYSTTIDKELGLVGKENLKSWIDAGGTLICLGGAVEWAVELGADWTSVTKLEATEDQEGTDDVATSEPLEVPGAFLRTVLDRDHFLSFGYKDDTMPMLVDSDLFLTASATGTNVLTFAEEGLWMSGVVWPGNTERSVAGTAAVVDEPLGDGHLVLFHDEPGFRALWYGTVRMFLNAIIYGPGLRNENGSYQP